MSLGSLAARLGATALRQAVARTARAALQAAVRLAKKLFASARVKSLKKTTSATITSPAFQANRVMRGMASINDKTSKEAPRVDVPPQPGKT